MGGRHRVRGLVAELRGGIDNCLPLKMISLYSPMQLNSKHEVQAIFHGCIFTWNVTKKESANQAKPGLMCRK